MDGSSNVGSNLGEGSVVKKDELVVTTADGQTVALEQLDERLYQPAPAP